MTQHGVLAAQSTAGNTSVAEATDARFRSDLARNVGSAYRLAAVILGNSADAEDVAHDAIERAWRARKSLHDAERFDAWLQRIVVNACRDRIRRRRAAPILVSIAGAHESSASAREPRALDPFAEMIARDSVRHAFARLNFDQRAVVAMRFYLDLEIDEIARRLGTRPGTVKSRLHRGLKVLRKAWEMDK